jgi:hypothetical protein
MHPEATLAFHRQRNPLYRFRECNADISDLVAIQLNPVLRKSLIIDIENILGDNIEPVWLLLQDEIGSAS